MNAKKRARIIEVGRRELASRSPDRFRLEAAIRGLGSSDNQQAVELLVTIFERTDLPGWLRGDAADKLGCCGIIDDRRTSLFRRSRDAALRGLDDESIDVQFWSMYLIGALCSDRRSRRNTRNNIFAPALRRLRKIAASDHRLSPGYWWPMSAEAEDIIGCIETGTWPDPDAAERWIENTARRGDWNRD